MTELTGYLSIEEVAKLLKFTHLEVYAFLRTGFLKGFKCGNKWFVKFEDFEQFKQKLKLSEVS